MESRKDLTKYAWLSIGVALLTIGLKVTAYWLTNSIGFLSDALESMANIIAALFALLALTIAARPADRDHTFGHSKIEFFASLVEGVLILIAAAFVAISAVQRLRDPQPLEDVAIGVVVSALAALANFTVARILMRAGEENRSATLSADGHHLMTDVYTSIGVIVGVAAVGLTGWERLDPIIALLVAAQIVYTGVKLVRIAVDGLMDKSLPDAELQQVSTILEAYAPQGVTYHALRTRLSGAQRFVEVHIQVPGSWSVQQGHELLESVEGDIRRELDPVTVFTHLEPAEDPVSFEDEDLYRPMIHVARENGEKKD